jgi:hypothetical protein
VVVPIPRRCVGEWWRGIFGIPSSSIFFGPLPVSNVARSTPKKFSRNKIHLLDIYFSIWYHLFMIASEQMVTERKAQMDGRAAEMLNRAVLEVVLAFDLATEYAEAIVVGSMFDTIN